MTQYNLYGAQVSLFSGKARAYLRWKGVDFTETPASQAVMRDIVPRIGWPVIPVMEMPDGTLIQDTADIMATIEALHPAPALIPSAPLAAFVSELLHTYADQWLTIPAMHYRWNYNEEFAYAEFGKMALPGASPDMQYQTGKKNGTKFKGFVPVLGINEQTIPAIEASYLAFLDEFSAHLRAHPFVMGASPSLADFAFYGPLYAHLYRDPESGKIMKARAPKVAAWTERLLTGDYGAEHALPNTVPETLLPLLARQFKEQVPVLLQTNALLGTWAKGQMAGAEVPRALGVAAFEIEGTKGNIIARPFSLYRLQAALDIYARMSASERQAADSILDAAGGEALKTLSLAARLTRHHYKLVLA